MPQLAPPLNALEHIGDEDFEMQEAGLQGFDELGQLELGGPQEVEQGRVPGLRDDWVAVIDDGMDQDLVDPDPPAGQGAPNDADSTDEEEDEEGDEAEAIRRLYEAEWLEQMQAVCKSYATLIYAFTAF